MDIRKGDRFTVLPGAQRYGGVVVSRSIRPGTLVEAYLSAVDSDGDARVAPIGSLDYQYILPRYLEPVTAPATAQGDRVPNPVATRVSATEAFAKEGNEIEFTVLALEEGDNFVAGCKQAPKTDVLPMLQKLDRTVGTTNQVELTFRAIVKDGRVGTDEVSIDRYDLDSYGQGIRIISFLEETKPDVTVTLTHAQAEAIAALGGSVAGSPSGYRGHAESGLVAIGVALGYEPDRDGHTYQKSPAYGVLTSHGVRFQD